MDYVKRRLEKVRQQGIEDKIQEAMSRQRLSPPATGDGADPDPASFGTGYRVALFLLGLAAGAAVTAGAWWVKSEAPAIEPRERNIELLNRRVEQLGEKIAGLEAGLARLLVLAESSGRRESTLSAAGADAIPGPAAAGSDTGADMPAVEAEAPEPVLAAVDEALIPTHSVSSALNLRPSASMDTVPVAVLPAGTPVRKISESGDWYYVDAGMHGKGWCFSRYLSPLL